jgi:hypothetical protein
MQPITYDKSVPSQAILMHPIKLVKKHSLNNDIHSRKKTHASYSHKFISYTNLHITIDAQLDN